MTTPTPPAAVPPAGSTSDTRARDLALIAAATAIGLTSLVCLTWLLVRERLDPIAGLAAFTGATNLASFLAGRLSGAGTQSTT